MNCCPAIELVAVAVARKKGGSWLRVIGVRRQRVCC